MHCHLLSHVVFEDDLKLNDYHIDLVNELEKRMHDLLPIYSHIHNTTYMKEIKMNTIRGTKWELAEIDTCDPIHECWVDVFSLLSIITGLN